MAASLQIGKRLPSLCSPPFPTAALVMVVTVGGNSFTIKLSLKLMVMPGNKSPKVSVKSFQLIIPGLMISGCGPACWKVRWVWLKVICKGNLVNVSLLVLVMTRPNVIASPLVTKPSSGSMSLLSI